MTVPLSIDFQPFLKHTALTPCLKPFAYSSDWMLYPTSSHSSPPDFSFPDYCHLSPCSLFTSSFSKHMLLHAVTSFHYLPFGFFLWFVLAFPMRIYVPMKSKISYVLDTELILAHRAVPRIKVVKYLLNRLIKFDCVTHPNTQTQWNTDTQRDTHAT